MQNYTQINTDTIQLPCGIFGGITRLDTYSGGELRGIRLAEKNVIVTHAGELIPAYTETNRRKNKYPVEFHQNGMLKVVALNEMQEIETPIGEFPAELVTFYETGEMNRFFPLNGQISGMWSEQDEKALAFPLNFEFPFAEFSAIIGSVAFYKNGCIRSITLFPGETVTMRTAMGDIPTRVGFSLYKSGELKSLESAEPFAVKTPIGEIVAYDPQAIGINADSNSLVFDKLCRVTAVTTVHNRIGVQTPEGELIMFTPTEKINPMDGETKITEGLRIIFGYKENTVTFDNKKPLSVKNSGFSIAEYNPASYCAPHECTNCGRH